MVFFQLCVGFVWQKNNFSCPSYIRMVSPLLIPNLTLTRPYTDQVLVAEPGCDVLDFRASTAMAKTRPFYTPWEINTLI